MHDHLCGTQYIAVLSDLDKSRVELHTRNGLICGHGIMHYELRIARHRSDGRGSSRFPNNVVTKSIKTAEVTKKITLITTVHSDTRTIDWGMSRTGIAAVAMGFSLTIRVPVRSESDLVSD